MTDFSEAPTSGPPAASAVRPPRAVDRWFDRARQALSNQLFATANGQNGRAAGGPPSPFRTPTTRGERWRGECCTCVRAKPIAAALPCLALIDALLQAFMAHQLTHPALPHVCRRVRSQACSQVSDAGLNSSSGYGETPLPAAAHRIRSVSSARRGESGAADAQKAKITDLRVRPRVVAGGGVVDWALCELELARVDQRWRSPAGSGRG